MQSSNKKNLPSITAFSVLHAFIIGLETEYAHLFPPEDLLLAKHIEKTVIQAEENYTNWAAMHIAQRAPYHLQFRLFDHVISPGYAAHKVGRKLLIQQKIDEAIKNGVTQFVFLGSGYSVQPYRISIDHDDHDDLKVYEIDYGLTRKNKIKALTTFASTNQMSLHIQQLSESFLILNNNLYCLECNLEEDDLAETLQAADFDKTKKTLVIAEGLTPYLPLPKLQDLTITLQDFLQEDDECVISFRQSGQYKSTIADRIQYAYDESYQCSLTSRYFPDFILTSDFDVTQRMLHQDILYHIGSPQAKLHTGNFYPKENYFTLKKTQTPQFKQRMFIGDIPNFGFKVDKQNLENITVGCTIS